MNRRKFVKALLAAPAAAAAVAVGVHAARQVPVIYGTVTGRLSGENGYRWHAKQRMFAEMYGARPQVIRFRGVTYANVSQHFDQLEARTLAHLRSNP